METWLLLKEKQPREPAENMAVDQHLLDLVDRGTIRVPILRTYAWRKPTLSLGYHQNWRNTVNLEEMRRHDIALVRRWTGGRAVLHDRDEITYSFIAPVAAPFGNRVSVNYRLIAECLERFTDLGEKRGRPAEIIFPESPQQRFTPCFASLSQSEIEAGGKKLIGSAQKIGKRGFLQHGSIPLLHRPEILESITGTQLQMSRYMVSLDDHYRAAGLALPPRNQLVDRLVRSFETRFGIRFEPLATAGFPVSGEVARIAEQVFAKESWTFRK